MTLCVCDMLKYTNKKAYYKIKTNKLQISNLLYSKQRVDMFFKNSFEKQFLDLIINFI